MQVINHRSGNKARAREANAGFARAVRAHDLEFIIVLLDQVFDPRGIALKRKDIPFLKGRIAPIIQRVSALGLTMIKPLNLKSRLERCDAADKRLFAHVHIDQAGIRLIIPAGISTHTFSSYPLMAPTIMPLMKYFCTNGYRHITGSDETMITA